MAGEEAVNSIRSHIRSRLVGGYRGRPFLIAAVMVGILLWPEPRVHPVQFMLGMALANLLYEGSSWLVNRFLDKRRAEGSKS